MDDRTDTYKTLDLALRIGEMLLSSGAGAADVNATMSSVAHASIHFAIAGSCKPVFGWLKRRPAEPRIPPAAQEDAREEEMGVFTALR